MKNYDVYTTINLKHLDLICKHLGGRFVKTVNGSDYLMFHGQFWVTEITDTTITFYEDAPMGVAFFAHYCQEMEIPFDSYRPELNQQLEEVGWQGRRLENGIFAVEEFNARTMFHDDEEYAVIYTQHNIDGKRVDMKKLDRNVPNDIESWTFVCELKDLEITTEEEERIKRIIFPTE